MTAWDGAVLTTSTVFLIYWLIEVRLLLAGNLLIGKRRRDRRF